MEPYKRYTFQMYFLCIFYLEAKEMSYRKSVKRDGRARNYCDNTEGRSLSPGTVWRWFLNTGSYKKYLTTLLSLGSEITRHFADIYSAKYRTLKRKLSLLAFGDFYYVIFQYAESYFVNNYFHRLWNGLPVSLI